MGKSATFENSLLKLIFNAVNISLLADNTATTPLTNLYVALHTADPSAVAGGGTLGAQNASEANYTGYARIAVVRTSGGWTVTGGSVSPAAAIAFGACTAGSNTITYWSVGELTSGAGVILYSGTVTPNITVTSGVTPSLTTASTVTES